MAVESDDRDDSEEEETLQIVPAGDGAETLELPETQPFVIPDGTEPTVQNPLIVWGDDLVKDYSIHSIVTDGSILPLPKFQSGENVADYSLISGIGSIEPMSIEPMEVLIKAGNLSGEATVTVPDIAGYKYCIELNLVGTTSFVQHLYYTEDGGSAIESKTDLVTKDDVLSFTLMKSITLSGAIKGFDDSTNRVYAKYKNPKTGIWINFDIQIIYGDDEYRFYLPDEVDEYIISAKLGGQMYYYCSNGLTESIDEAEILTVNDYIKGINFIFIDGIPEISVKASLKNAVGNQIEAAVTSKYDEENLSVFLVFFNRFGKIIDIQSRTNVSLSAFQESELPGPYYLIYFNNVENTSYMKLFVWKNNLKPISMPVYLHKPNECYVVDLEKIAELDDEKLLKAYNSDMLPSNFDENIALAQMVTRQDVAELCVNVYEKATGTKIKPQNKYPFTDTQNEDDAKAKEIGAMQGYEDKTFRPGGTMMNCELILCMYNLAQRLEINLEIGDAPVRFSDVNTTDWYYSYLLKMQNSGLLEDAFGEMLNPYDMANPRDAIKIAYNIYHK